MNIEHGKRKSHEMGKSVWKMIKPKVNILNYRQIPQTNSGISLTEKE